MIKRTFFFFLLVLEGLLGLQLPVSCNFFGISGWGVDLHYHDAEWCALEMNRDHSVVFEIASKYCISHCFVDYESYSISSEGFLPTVIDIMSSELIHSLPCILVH